MFGLGPGELVVILIIVLIIFGVGRLPEIGTGLGEGIKNFRKSYRDSKALDVTPEGGGREEKTADKSSSQEAVKQRE